MGLTDKDCKVRGTDRRRGGRLRFLSLLLPVLGGLMLVGGCGGGGDYPNRPITLICPWSAGGGTDRVSRQVAHQLEEELGVPVNVINATGGAGVTGHTRGAMARPDGYTLTMATVELNMLHWRGLTPITYEDFRPGVLLNRDAAALFVRSDSPWDDLDALARHVEEEPTRLKASGTAQGGIWHLALAGWLTALGEGADAMTWISINGAAPSLQELMAGGVEVVCCSLPEAKSLLDAGRIRCLGVMAEERLDQFPEVPTFKEQGIDWAMGGWRGVAMPAETPDRVAETVVDALTKIVKSEEFREFMRRAGFNWSYEGPEAFEASLEAMDRQFGKVLTSEAFQESMGGHPVGPMFFPAILAIVGAVVLVVLLAKREPGRAPRLAGIPPAGWRRLAEMLLCIVIYLLVAEWLGFLLTATPLLLLAMLRLGAPWQWAVPVALLLVPAAYQVFAVSLRVPLPQGWFGW